MPWPPPPLPAPAGGEKRNVGKVVTYAALAVALLAGGTTAVLLAINARQNATQKDAQKDAQKDGAQETATTAPQSAAARDGAAPLPTDTMLIRVDPAGAEAARESKIYTLTPGNSGRKPLLNTKAGDVLPKWSHTRKQIALTGLNKDGTTAIFIMNADGSDRRKLVDGGGRPAWSADDKKIAFVRWVDKVPQLFVVTVASRAVKQLTHSPILKDDAMWSPDGASIVYWLNKDGIKQIYELDVADPKEPGRQIVGPQAGPANDPVYSPDGKQVLYTRDLDAGTTSDIWLVNVDGSNPHRVTDNPAREVDPTWSPDGRWLAFMRGEFSDPTIVVQRLDGTGEMTLTAAGQREGHPCWF